MTCRDINVIFEVFEGILVILHKRGRVENIWNLRGMVVFSNFQVILLKGHFGHLMCKDVNVIFEGNFVIFHKRGKIENIWNWKGIVVFSNFQVILLYIYILSYLLYIYIYNYIFVGVKMWSQCLEFVTRSLARRDVFPCLKGISCC